MCMLPFKVISQIVALSLGARTEWRTSAPLLTDWADHHVSLSLVLVNNKERSG